ncbi:MAG: VWA domain-containing protein [Candidatus Helarchaeota archaeon]
MIRRVFPFSAIVAQDQMKLALVLNVVNPLIGGVLIRGERGTGKSTAVRALAKLLPKMKAVKGCPFNCDPDNPETLCSMCKAKYDEGNGLEIEEREMRVVEIPLGVTEDRVVGSLDIECAIREGIRALEPGILAAANRNILYVDEINLLSDHIIDDLLDSAAMGVNTIEREGISVSHPSNFILVGSMNPEEGELRPQILDRLGLTVDVATVMDFNQRLEILKRVEMFDTNPDSFREKFKESESELQKRIIKAKEIVNEVKIPQKLMEVIVKLCMQLQVETHRGEITIARCAKAIAALAGRKLVTRDDVEKAAMLALMHRVGKPGITKPEEAMKQIKNALEDAMNEMDSEGTEESQSQESITSEENNKKKNELMSEQEDAADSLSFLPSEQTSVEPFEESNEAENPAQEFEGEIKGFDGAPDFIDKNYKPKSWRESLDHLDKVADASNVFKLGRKNVSAPRRTPTLGKRIRKQGTAIKGKYIAYKIPKEKASSIAFDATIRAAAPFQKHRSERNNLSLKIDVQDIREKIYEYQAPLSIVFVLDASGSMFRMLKQMKKVILSLHDDAYQNRDKVGLVVFQGYEAVVLQQPTVNLPAVVEKLSFIQSDSWTPLASGLQKGLEILKTEVRRNRDIIPVLVVLTDGGANVPISQNAPPAFHNSQYYNQLEDEIVNVSEELRDAKIFTIVLWPENAKMRGPRHRRIAEAIANNSGGDFFVIKSTAEITDLIRGREFFEMHTTGR